MFISKTFPIVFGDGSSGTQLMRAGRYDYISEDARECARSIVPQRLGVPGEADIVLCQFGFAPTLYQVWSEYKVSNLSPPTKEDALRFGAMYPKEQQKTFIVFPHAPWVSETGEIGVFVLGTGLTEKDRGRILISLYLQRWEGPGWPVRFIFAARRETPIVF